MPVNVFVKPNHLYHNEIRKKDNRMQPSIRQICINIFLCFQCLAMLNANLRFINSCNANKYQDTAKKLGLSSQNNLFLINAKRNVHFKINLWAHNLCLVVLIDILLMSRTVKSTVFDTINDHYPLISMFVSSYHKYYFLELSYYLSILPLYCCLLEAYWLLFWHDEISWFINTSQCIIIDSLPQKALVLMTSCRYFSLDIFSVPYLEKTISGFFL